MLMLIMYHCGLQPGEIVRITAADYNPTTGVIGYYSAIDGYMNAVFVPTELRPLLDAYMRDFHIYGMKPLFGSGRRTYPRSDEPARFHENLGIHTPDMLSPNSVNRIVKKAFANMKDEFNGEHITPSDFHYTWIVDRHPMASKENNECRCSWCRFARRKKRSCKT